jgi:hypothetical protein
MNHSCIAVDVGRSSIFSSCCSDALGCEIVVMGVACETLDKSATRVQLLVAGTVGCVGRRSHTWWMSKCWSNSGSARQAEYIR